MAKFFDRLFSCQNKIRFSAQKAEEAAVEMEAKTGKPFRAYKCRHCSAWHIGHVRSKEKNDG